MKMKNIFWIKSFDTIGGTEEYILQLVKKYDRDITVFYRWITPEQLARLKQHVRCIQWDGQTKYECETYFQNYDSSMLNFVTAKNYYQVLHNDYKWLNIKPNLDDRFTKYIACSNYVRDTFIEHSGIDPDKVVTVYNPFELEEEDRKPTLIIGSFTRLAPEKGRGRMEQLARKLDSIDGLNYLWLVYTNDTKPFDSRNVVFVPSRLYGIKNMMAACDLVAQLSDVEGYSYTIVETLSVGTPLLYTPVPSIIEAGLSDQDIRLEFDMSNIDEVADRIVQMYEKKKKRKCSYVKNDDRYGEYLAEGKKDYKGEEKMLIKAKRDYFDNEKKKNILTGEVYEVSEERAEVICNAGFAERVQVKVKKSKKKQEE